MSNIFFNIDFKIDVESETILTSFILTMVQNQYLMSIKIDVEFYFCSGGENECLPQNNSHHHSLIFSPSPSTINPFLFSSTIPLIIVPKSVQV